MKKLKRHIVLFCLVLLSLLPLWDLLHPGLPVTHDGQDHVARIANFYASLAEGNIVPRWASNLNWGYGHPILMFLYPLPSYAASLFHAVGFSFVDSTKLVLGWAFIASVFTMYLWASLAWGRLSGFAAAVLYAFAPYRFVDLYVRGAIGEHMAFVFPPLICYGILRKSFVITAAGTALLILSHNALSLMFLPLVVLYAIYVAYSETKRPLWLVAYASLGIVFGFLLSAFYWAPALFEGKYTLRDIVTASEFADRFVPWISFLYSPWSYGGGNELSKWLGGGQLFVLIVSLAVIEKTSKYQRFLIVTLLLLFFSLFAQTAIASPMWKGVTLLQKFQFPWRFLSVTTFLIAVIGALVARVLQTNKKRWVVVVLCIVTVIATVPMWRAKDYKTYPEPFFTGIYNSTTDTGESSPIWSVRFMEQRPDALSYLVPTSGDITVGERSTTTRTYEANVTAAARFIENTLYFPGWQVVINGSTLPSEKLIFQDPAYRGLMTFDLDPGSYTIKFVFTETKLRRLSNYISLASFVAFCIGAATIHILWRKRRYV